MQRRNPGLQREQPKIRDFPVTTATVRAMADFNATFANNDTCTLLNVDGVAALCACSQIHNSLRRLNKDRRARARHTRDAVCGCSSGRNALTKCHGHGRGRRCC